MAKTAHPSTRRFLDKVEVDASKLYSVARSAVRGIIPQLAALEGAAARSQTELHDAMEDETDGSLRGQLYEATDKQKTIVRLAGEARSALQLLSAHLRDTEDHRAKVRNLIEAP